MKQIPLTRGYKAKVDNEDFDLISSYKWHANVTKSGQVYAYAHVRGERWSMHRAVMSAPRSKVVDHINGDTLDNRKQNLRLCTHKENILNSPKVRNGGASFSKYANGWIARVSHNGKRVYVGLYKTKQEALAAANRKRKELGIITKPKPNIQKRKLKRRD